MGDSSALSTVLLKESPKTSLPARFALCFAMKHDKIDGRSPFLLKDSKNMPWLALSIWNQGNQLALWAEIGRKDWKMFPRLDVPWKFWAHICADIDTVTGNIAVSVDGRPIISKSSEKLETGKPENLEQKLEIGITDSDVTNGGRRQFTGSFSNLNFYLHDKSTTSLEELSKEPCKTEGNKREVCAVLPDLYKVLLPGKMRWSQANFLCKFSGNGWITDIRNDEDLQRVSSLVRNASDLCPLIWLPLSDQRNGGIWENTNSNSVAKYLRWSEGQPNGLRTQNHAVLDVKSLHFLDFFDEDNHCAYCTLSTNATLNLRGLCKDSYLDTTYVAVNIGKGFKLSGSFYTNIRYDEAERLWKAENEKYPSFLATSDATRTSLLIGQHTWSMFNDSKACSLDNTYTSVLKLTGCSEEEFTCHRGSCVPMSERCDGKKDCPDGTDEADCKAFVQEIGYDRFIAPPSLDNGTKPQLHLTLELERITEINEKNGFFRCQLWLGRKWIDKRLSFQNLKKESELNEINPEDRDTIWKPWTAYKNIEDRSKYARTDLKQVWRVIPNSNFSFERADTSVLSNTYFFDGASNMISYEIGYTTEWLCDFHMAWYPFDSQSCTMKFLQQEDSLVLVPETVEYIGGDLAQHFIRNITMCSIMLDGKQGVAVEVILGRPVFSSFLTVTLPTCMLMFLSQLINMFTDQFLTMVIQVNLTVMLVLATFFIGISQSLPTTSYIKMIDIWMIFTMMYPFTEIALVCAKDFFKKRALSKQVDPELNSKQGFVVPPRQWKFYDRILPTIALLFTIA